MGMKWHQVDQLTTEAQADALLAAGILGPDRQKDSNFRHGTGHVRIGVNVQAADTVTITSPAYPAGRVYTWNGAAPQDPAVGGNAAASAANLTAAVNGASGNGDVVAATRESGNIGSATLNTVDLICTAAGAFAVAESTAGARSVAQDNGDEFSGEVMRKMIRHVVTAEDVARGQISLDYGMASIVHYWIDVHTAANDQTRIVWNGATNVVTAGVLRVDNSGLTDWAAGNVIYALVEGTA